uniref:Box C/D snoRNA protein 1 n=1 Tax=Leersia perrieri TaxID=77586 RepID=A0A0D9VAM3_9ORYZ
MEEQGGEPPVAEAGASSGGGGGGERKKKAKGDPCEECGEQPWKYRCPGCSILTCSLPCVQSHKRRTSCSGKRPRTDPVPIAQFDDNQLISDYNFLEETKQATESAHRLIGAFGRNFGGKFGGAQLPKWLFFLRKAAQRRGIWLTFLPRGMARREQNRSRHNHNIDEHTSLLSSLEKHLTPGPWKDQLTPYRNIDSRDLKLFIQKSAKVSVSPYRQLNIEEPLGPQLRSINIVEYPSINVFLPSDSCDFEVEKIVNKLPANEKPPGSSTDSPDLEGTEFHEEEIEEGELATETQVIDLKDSGTSHTSNLASAKDTSDVKTGSNRDSSVISYASSLALDGQQVVSKQIKITPNTTSGASKTKNCMKVHPADMEESGDGGLSLERQGINRKNHTASHPDNLTPVEGTTESKIDSITDSLVPSSVSILASDAFGCHQVEHNQQSKPTPNSTPEALKRKSCMKVYPLDTEKNPGLFSEVPNLSFEQEFGDAYSDLFGDINPDDFLNFDLEIMDEDDLVGATSPVKLWDDLEEGEIPTA